MKTDARSTASRFTVGSLDAEGWEVAWLNRPGLVVLGLFDHVVSPGGSTDLEQLEHPVSWPEDIVNCFLPSDQTWIIDVDWASFRGLAGRWPWSREREQLRDVGARWSRSLGGRVLANLPASLGASRLKPFAGALTVPDQLVSWAFIPANASMRLAMADDWCQQASQNAATLVASVCDRILALQDDHVFVGVSAHRRQELDAGLKQAAQQLALPSPTPGRTLRSSPLDCA